MCQTLIISLYSHLMVLFLLFPFPRFEMDNEVYAISKELMEGPGEDLFDYIAECLHKFAKSRGVDAQVGEGGHLHQATSTQF